MVSLRGQLDKIAAMTPDLAAAAGYMERMRVQRAME
jgi:hypothetical protein